MILRVLLADDHRLLVEGLSNFLEAHGFEVLGIASDGFEAISLARSLRPDIILMDVRMPICNGLEATRRIKAVQPDVRIVMLTTSSEDQDLFESIKCGADGYLLKSMSGDAFVESLQGLEHGIPPFSPGLAAKLLNEFSRIASQPGKIMTEEKSTANQPHMLLTERQTEVLRLVAAGLTYKEVGRQLSLSERTVRYHMVEIMQRLHLEHRNQVIAYAAGQGLLGSE